MYIYIYIYIYIYRVDYIGWSKANNATQYKNKTTKVNKQINKQTRQINTNRVIQNYFL